mmetsp:Transcript_13715/g.44795  ORF Transcript_13715/g.44795 Transcript_13715/m.44795 type:complete len:414 (+) Transcript_13715:89-1330(+)
MFGPRTWGAGRRMLQVIDCHAAGEPARVVLGGLPRVPGTTMLEKREHMRDHMDALRKLLLLEPRGYPCQNANFVFPSEHPEADFGFVIAEQGRIYPMMSGHNAMCVVTALLETGMVPMCEGPTTCFGLESPAGIIAVEAECDAGRVASITLRNQPAFCRPRDLDVEIDVPQYGKVCVSLAYGGMHYAIVDAASVGLRLEASRAREICRLGEMIKIATREQHPVTHPELDYTGPDILVFREASAEEEPAVAGARLGAGTIVPALGGGAAADAQARGFVEAAGGMQAREPHRVLPPVRARNAVVMSNGELDWTRPETWTGMIDRSPCGTGTCAVMAVLHARGELAIGQDFVHESILGTTFVGRLLSTVPVGQGTSDEVVGVVPTIRGRAWVTQYATIVLDPTDPFPEGYTMGDIW